MKAVTICLLFCLGWIVSIAFRMLLAHRASEPADGCDIAAEKDHEQAELLAQYADSQTRAHSEHLLCTLEADGRDDA